MILSPEYAIPFSLPSVRHEHDLVTGDSCVRMSISVMQCWNVCLGSKNAIYLVQLDVDLVVEACKLAFNGWHANVWMLFCYKR